MAEKPTEGEFFGIPYNFERPSLSRLIEAYWQPGEQMLVKKPFGIGYTLNLANWRSWIVLMVAGAMVWLEHSRGGDAAGEDESDPVEIIVDDED